MSWTSRNVYIAPKNEPALPVAPVSQKQLDEWSQQTETPRAGAIRKGGQWRVYLAEADNQGDALGIYQQLRSAGYAAEIRPVKTAEGLIYRVRISNLPDRREAAALAAKLEGKMGIAGPRVSK